MNAPQDDHNDPLNKPTTKIENSNDEAGNATEEYEYDF